MKSLKSYVMAALLVAASSAAQAVPIVFDFESTPTGSSTSLVLNNSGLTLTIARIGGAAVEVATRTSYPASWGDRALSPFLNVGGGAFLLTFSQAISSLSVDVGDFAPSDSDSFTVTAGGQTASASQLATTGFPTFTTLSLAGLNTTAAFFSGGSAAFPQSVFWDNIRVNLVPTRIPEPATLLLLGIGLLSLGLSRRRQRA